MIKPVIRTVYLAPTRGRHYMTKASAIRAEATALIIRRHPTEEPDYDQGHMLYPGFHWTELPRHAVLLRRVCRLVKNAKE